MNTYPDYQQLDARVERIDRKFRWAMALALAATLGLLADFILLRPQPGRYVIVVQSGSLVRFDTATGRTWREVDAADHTGI